MNIRSWVAFIITYVLLVTVEVLASYFVGHILLQMPMMDVYIVTGCLVLAVTFGMIIPIIYVVKRKKH